MPRSKRVRVVVDAEGIPTAGSGGTWLGEGGGLDEHDDVQNVYSNFDMDEKTMEQATR